MIRKLLVAATAISLITLPAMAQTTSADKNTGPHYSGGPRAEPHHTGKKETTGKKSTSGGSHHYYGGPKSEVPHHMGPKKDQ